MADNLKTNPLHEIDRPIFIIGTGRSGTTFLFHIMRRHPQLAWLCQYRTRIGLTRYDRTIIRLRKVPLLGDPVFRILRKPRALVEPYAFWQRFMPGFNRPCRDLTADDLYLMNVSGVRKAISEQIAEMKKPRFMGKYTGWSRIGLMEQVFPGARFINVIRDGRAVAWSLLNVPWWLGWRGPEKWRWGNLEEEDRDIWERSGKSFFVLAGLQWKILMENLREKGASIGDRYLEIRYEDLVASPMEVISQMLQWADLSIDPKFIDEVKRLSKYDANQKWKEQVDDVQKRAFDSLLGPALDRFGYEVNPEY